MPKHTLKPFSDRNPTPCARPQTASGSQATNSCVTRLHPTCSCDGDVAVKAFTGCKRSCTGPRFTLLSSADSLKSSQPSPRHTTVALCAVRDVLAASSRTTSSHLAWVSLTERGGWDEGGFTLTRTREVLYVTVSVRLNGWDSLLFSANVFVHLVKTSNPFDVKVDLLHIFILFIFC